MLRISTIKNWKRLIGDLRSKKRYALMGIDFVSSPVLCHVRYKTGDISLNGYNMNNRTIAEYVK